MKTCKEPIMAYAVEAANALNSMLKEIERCNKVHRKETNEAIDKFTRDVEMIRDRYCGAK
jgi:hypothetical protein